MTYQLPDDLNDIAHRELMLAVAADLVMDYGDAAMPLFEKCESLLEIAISRASTKDRARLIASKVRVASQLSN